MPITLRCLLLVVVVVLTTLLASVHGAPKELVVSYRACTEGQGCHVIDQVTFHDSHILTLTSHNYQKHLQGRIVDLGTGCPRADDDPNYAKNNADGSHKANGHRHRRPTVGLVRCGTCPLSDMLREAAQHGVSGVVITNTEQCGRPSGEFIELTSSLGFPVTFVSDKVAKEIQSMHQQVLELRRKRKEHTDGLRRFEFVYVSAVDDGVPRLRHVLVRILASTHVLLAAVAVLALAVYFCLACSVGSLRNVPREIAPGIFGTRAEPVDLATIERLPLVTIEWDVPSSDSCYNTPGIEDEESRHESPGIAACHSQLCSEKQVVQRQLASIIQTCGASSYSFTDEIKCAICLGRYIPKESLRLLPCKHAFHQRCIDTWLLSKDMTVHCPVCKCSIVDGLRLLDKHGYNEILDLLHHDPAKPPSMPEKPTATVAVYAACARDGVARAAAAVFNYTFGRWRNQQ
ncbi:E3 ubiquitin-protein ligase znrf3 [Coemansia aciculifera]|nr:E3 ubiquitin-protein ligase znrf3 [Coemansia aciculifera]